MATPVLLEQFHHGLDPRSQLCSHWCHWVGAEPWPASCCGPLTHCQGSSLAGPGPVLCDSEQVTCPLTHWGETCLCKVFSTWRPVTALSCLHWPLDAAPGVPPPSPPGGAPPPSRRPALGLQAGPEPFLSQLLSTHWSSCTSGLSSLRPRTASSAAPHKFITFWEH